MPSAIKWLAIVVLPLPIPPVKPIIFVILFFEKQLGKNFFRFLFQNDDFDERFHKTGAITVKLFPNRFNGQ
jgi:hypothetical protein